jgi:hypothetical protein
MDLDTLSRNLPGCALVATEASPGADVIGRAPPRLLRSPLATTDAHAALVAVTPLADVMAVGSIVGPPPPVKSSPPPLQAANNSDALKMLNRAWLMSKPRLQVISRRSSLPTVPGGAVIALTKGQIALCLVAVGAQEIRGLAQPRAGVAIAVATVSWRNANVAPDILDRRLQCLQQVRKGG